MSPHSDDHEDNLRLDKWLWAARFFKTRSLAQAAIKGGKIEVNGEKPKTARPLQIDDTVRIRRGRFESTVKVTGLSKQRGSATVAAHLYEETSDSIVRRQTLAEAMRLTATSAPQYAGRPNKRDRRHIVRFTRKRDA